jgi:hypothetical protein
VEDILCEYEDYLPLTVRQIFYRLVAAHGYEKTERAYERLAEHLVRARRARLIEFDDIRDDGIVIYSPDWYSDVQDFHEQTAERARRYQVDRQAGQAYRIELWSEAAGMAPQLARVANVYSIPVYSSGGFSSLSAVRQVVDRACERYRPTVLLHVGDHDPSGEAIFTTIAEDVVAFFEEDKVLASQEIIPVRVALTADQIAEFGLPTSPAKNTDSRSNGWAGSGTCQLESLPPDDLARLVEDAIKALFDIKLLNHVLERESVDRAELLGLPRGDGGAP